MLKAFLIFLIGIAVFVAFAVLVDLELAFTATSFWILLFITAGIVYLYTLIKQQAEIDRYSWYMLFNKIDNDIEQ